eukprot:749450-Hanusia_phi.AAC.1
MVEEGGEVRFSHAARGVEGAHGRTIEMLPCRNHRDEVRRASPALHGTQLAARGYTNPPQVLCQLWEVGLSSPCERQD